MNTAFNKIEFIKFLENFRRRLYYRINVKYYDSSVINYGLEPAIDEKDYVNRMLKRVRKSKNDFYDLDAYGNLMNGDSIYSDHYKTLLKYLDFNDLSKSLNDDWNLFKRLYNYALSI